VAEKRTLRFFDALPPYLGGKRRLLGPIFKEVAKHLDPIHWKQSSFVDGFMGGGSVSIYAKSQFKTVRSNDLSDRSTTIANAVLVNDNTYFGEAHPTMILEGCDSSTNYAQSLEDWFIPSTARVIDRGLAYADSLNDPRLANMVRLVIWRCILYSRPTSGDFTSRNLLERALTGELKASGVAGAKFAFRAPSLYDIKSYCKYTNNGIFRGAALTYTQGDALVESEGWGHDVVYLDPPYAGDTGYDKFYGFSDKVMAQRELAKGGKNPFTERDSAESAIHQLIHNTHKAGGKLLLLNNSDESIPRERLLAIVSECYEAYEVPLVHRHTFASGRGNDGDASGSTEVFVVGRRKG